MDILSVKERKEQSETNQEESSTKILAPTTTPRSTNNVPLKVPEEGMHSLYITYVPYKILFFPYQFSVVLIIYLILAFPFLLYVSYYNFISACFTVLFTLEMMALVRVEPCITHSFNLMFKSNDYVCSVSLRLTFKSFLKANVRSLNSIKMI